MAVTTQVTVNPQYILSGGSIPGCIGGGEDYRTLNNNTVTEFLYIRGWAGDNISSACVITEIVVKGCQCKLTNASGGYAISGRSCNIRRSAVVSQGSVSGTNFNRTTGTTLENTGLYVSMNRNDYASIDDNNFNYRTASEEQLQYLQANKAYPGVKIELQSPNHIRGYIKGITLTVTRTRACYITFKGDGVTEKTTMYDYGTVPSYGSTPTRDGYTFKGWSNGSTTYSGTLPTAYEQDVTYTAVWEKNKVACTITYNGNGATGGSVAAQSGYVNEALTLAANGFKKQYRVYYCSNEDSSVPDDDFDNIGNTLSSATFLGWYTAASGGSKVTSPYTPTSASVTLYAHWSGMSAVTTPTPTRDGYTFLGWYTARSGGTKVADGGGSYTPSGSITLYAQWEEIIVPPEIISAAITYSGTQVSAANKVPAGEGFLIAVGVK